MVINHYLFVVCALSYILLYVCIRIFFIVFHRFAESPTDESEVFTGTEIVLLEEISNTQMKNDAEHSAENILFIFSCICIFIAIVAIAITMNINKNCWDRSQTKR